jgi:PKHD-type hydroxylase
MLYPIEPKAIPGRDTHAWADGIFTNDELTKILSLPQWNQSETASVGGSSNQGSVNNNIRRSNVAWIYPTPETMFIWEKVSAAIADINSRFFRFDLTGCYEPFQLGIYSGDIQGHYNWHTDAGMYDVHVPRKLSMTLMLSDPSEYVGGELQLKTESDEAITVQTPKGRAWFFPSYTLHRVAPVTKGVRRSLVIWVGGPAFK